MSDFQGQGEPRYTWGLADEVVEKFLLDVQKIVEKLLPIPPNTTPQWSAGGTNEHDLYAPSSVYRRVGEEGWPRLTVTLPSEVIVIAQDGRNGGEPAGTITVWDDRTLVEKRLSVVQDDLTVPNHAETTVAHYITGLEPEDGGEA